MYIEDSNQFAHPHSLISLSFMPKETLDHWLHIEFPSKTLVRLHKCAVRSESSMGAHAKLIPFAGPWLNIFQSVCFRCESEVQVPVPVKPVVASSALSIGHSFPCGGGLMSRTGGFIPHLPTSTSLGMSLSSNLALFHNSTNPRMPVKLYPWKPNMYIV